MRAKIKYQTIFVLGLIITVIGFLINGAMMVFGMILVGVSLQEHHETVIVKAGAGR